MKELNTIIDNMAREMAKSLHAVAGNLDNPSSTAVKLAAYMLEFYAGPEEAQLLKAREAKDMGILASYDPTFAESLFGSGEKSISEMPPLVPTNKRRGRPPKVVSMKLLGRSRKKA